MGITMPGSRSIEFLPDYIQTEINPSTVIKKGVEITKTAAYAPFSNAFAERVHQTIMFKVRTMLWSLGVPFSMFGSIC